MHDTFLRALPSEKAGILRYAIRSLGRAGEGIPNVRKDVVIRRRWYDAESTVSVQTDEDGQIIIEGSQEDMLAVGSIDNHEVRHPGCELVSASYPSTLHLQEGQVRRRSLLFLFLS